MLLFFEYNIYGEKASNYLHSLYSPIITSITLGSIDSEGLIQYPLGVSELIITNFFVVLLIGACVIGFIKAGNYIFSSKEATDVCFQSSISFCLILFKKILVLPICFTAGLWLVCDHVKGEISCYGDIHIFLIILELLILLLVILLSMLMVLFFADENPNSTIPWALCDRKIEFVKLMKYILIGLVMAIDFNCRYYVAYLLFVIISDCFILYGHLFFCTYLRTSIQLGDIANSMVTLMVSIYLIILSQTSDSFVDCNLLILIFFPFILGLFLMVKENRKIYLKETLFPKTEITSSQIKEQSYLVMSLIDGTKNQGQLAEIAGVLHSHMRLCCFQDCKCRDIKIRDNDLFISKEKFDDKKTLGNNTILNEGMTNDNFLLLEKGLYEILNFNLSKIENSDITVDVEIVKSYLNYCKLKRTFTALYHLMLAEDYGLSLYQEFQIFSIRQLVETYISKEETQNVSGSKMNFDKIVCFHQKYMILLDLILTTTNDFELFWVQFLKAKPELNEIVKIGFEISLKCELIEKTLEYVLSLDPSNLKGLLLFGLFQKRILEDDYGAFETYQKARHEEENHHLNNNFLLENNRFSSNSNTAVIIVSGNRSNLGTVINANNELDQILGFHKSELVGENVSLLMPEIIGNIHNYFIQYYFERPDQEHSYVTKERITYCQHSKGYFLPCILLVRLIPNLEKGVQFIGFLQKAEEYEEYILGEKALNYNDLIILLLDKEYRIQGLNKIAALICCENENELQIHKYLRSNQKLSLPKILPDIFSEANLEMYNVNVAVQIIGGVEILRQALSAEILDHYSEEEVSLSNQSCSWANISNYNIMCKLIHYKPESGKGDYSVCIFSSSNSLPFKSLKAPSIESIHIGKKSGLCTGIDLEEKEMTASVTTSSNWSNSNIDERFAKEMKYSMKNNKVSRSVRILQFLAIVVSILLIVMSTVMYVIHKQNLEDVNQIMDLVSNVLQRHNALILLPSAILIVRNIAFDIMRINSSISSIESRYQYYVDLTNTECENLRIFENAIISNSFAHKFSYYIYKTVSFSLLDEGAWSYQEEKSSKTEMDAHSAISTVVGKMSVFKDMTLDTIMNAKGLLENLEIYERAYFACRINNNGELREISEQFIDSLFEYSKSFFNSEKNTLNILDWILLALSVITTLILIPFLFRAQKNILHIVNLFFEIDLQEIRVRIINYKEIYDEFGKNFELIQKHFWQIDFSPDNHSKSSTPLQNQPQTSIESIEEKKEHETSSIIEQKAKLQEMNNNSNYNFLFVMIKMLSVSIFFVTYFLVQYFIAANFFDKANYTLKFLMYIRHREPIMTCMSSYLIETLNGGKAFIDSDGDELFIMYYNQSLEIEANILKMRQEMNHYYSDLMIQYNQMEGNNVCEITGREVSAFSVNSCQTDVNGWANLGITKTIGIFHMLTYKIYYYFLSNSNPNNQTLISYTYKNSGIEELVDVTRVYFEKINSVYISSFQKHSDKFFDNNMVLQQSIFIIYIFCIILIFLFIVQLIILGLNSEIWRARRLLALYPSRRIVQNLDFFRKVLQSLSQSWKI